jgi:hypothetical protein
MRDKDLEALPCPFCGEHPCYWPTPEQRAAAEESWCVIKCSCKMQPAIHVAGATFAASRRKALAIWNTRKLPTPNNEDK